MMFHWATETGSFIIQHGIRIYIIKPVKGKGLQASLRSACDPI
jgi:hypothetical protein